MSEARETADLYPSVVEGVGNSTGNFYRTNTWTPYYSSAGATTAFVSDVFTTASYSRQIGEYTRIGDMVFATANIVIDHSAAGYQNGGASGQIISIAGLPFRAKNTDGYYPMTSTIYFDFDTAQGWSKYNLVGYLVFNKKYIRINYSTTGGTTNGVLTNNVYDTTNGTKDSQVLLSIAYCTDEA